MAEHPLDDWQGERRPATVENLLDALHAVNKAEAEWESVKQRLEYYSGHHAYEEVAESRRNLGLILDAYIDQRVRAAIEGGG
jgi:hypothetical protein